MELYEDVENKKKSKTPKIIGIFIAILIVLIIVIIGIIIYLQSTVLSIKLDGQTNNDIEKILYFTGDENNQKIYIPIRAIAKYFNYEDYRGDYIVKSEDENKCYVKNENEVAMFTKDSDTLVKTEEDLNYEYIKLDEAVFEKDGELYTTIEGAEHAFNILVENNLPQNKINIYTMEYLNKIYASNLGITNNNETEKTSDVFSDKKAIFKNMIVIIKNNQYGVITTEGKSVLEPKYEEIKYLPSASEFLVKSNGKYGIVGDDSKPRTKVVYDEIKIMDSQNELYVVKKNNLYGVIDKDGKTIIESAYTQIGIDATKYQQNGIENKYVLLNEVIPIKNSEGLWALFNIKGEKITDFEFSNIGCSSVKEANAYPAVIMPSYKIIVVEKDKHYNLLTSSGEQLIPSYILDYVYIKYNSETGENKYYMTFNNNEKTINIEDWLASIGR